MNSTQPKYATQAGFTLIELVVTMTVFIIIMIIASNAFNKIVTQTSRYSKMEESNIEGNIGLEIMRHDLEQIGFGLPWGWSYADPPAGATLPLKLISDTDPATPATISYSESSDSIGSLLNDSPSDVPRAIASSDVLGNFTSAYIALKGSGFGRSKASQRWTKIPFHNYSANPRESRPVIAANSPLKSDKVIMITTHFNDANLDHRLIVDPVDNKIFHQSFNETLMSSNFLPIDDLQTFMVYGIDDGTTVRMPFNRSDYFIKIPSGVTSTGDGTLPSFCAPRTGILYKATVNHADGKYNYIPLLDCAADMQVVLGWDTSVGGSAGAVNVYSSTPKLDGTVVSSDSALAGDIQGYLTNAKSIREHLKVVKVYILAQEGKVDPSYSSPVSSIEIGDRVAHGLYPTKTYSLSAAQKHYRWKLYRIVARPKNLSSNQH